MSKRVEQIDKLVSHARQVALNLNESTRGWDHMGALLTDAGLQSFINYKRVVLPRVLRVKEEWPDAATVSGFRKRLGTTRFSEFLGWGGPKPAMIEKIADALYDLGIDTVSDLRTWYGDEELELDLRFELVQIKGVARKTLNYIAILAGSSKHVAVDRQLTQFARDAGVAYLDEYFLQSFYIGAAKRLGCSPAALDSSVWQFMTGVSES